MSNCSKKLQLGFFFTMTSSSAVQVWATNMLSVTKGIVPLPTKYQELVFCNCRNTLVFSFLNISGLDETTQR